MRDTLTYDKDVEIMMKNEKNFFIVTPGISTGQRLNSTARFKMGQGCVAAKKWEIPSYKKCDSGERGDLEIPKNMTYYSNSAKDNEISGFYWLKGKIRALK